MPESIRATPTPRPVGPDVAVAESPSVERTLKVGVVVLHWVVSPQELPEVVWFHPPSDIAAPARTVASAETKLTPA